jgi:WD40 repeat protein/mono/diheme cytochrome c family protein
MIGTMHRSDFMIWSGRLGWTALLIAAMAPSVYGGDPKKDPAGEVGPVSYYKSVRPIFQHHCQGCHQPAKASGSFVMTGYADLLKKGDSDKHGIIPGQPAKSYLVEQISAEKDKKPAMPPKGETLTDADVKLIVKWIAEGAKDDTPAKARVVVDPDHPPVYNLPPVITSIAYSPDGKHLAVAGYHEVLLHKADGSGLEARLVGQSERISSLAFSPDGKLLAVTGGSPGRFGEVQIWDAAKKRLKLSVPVTFDTIYGASWSHDGNLVAFGCTDNSVRAIDAATGEQVYQNGGHNDWVLDTVFSKDSSHLISVSRDMSMKLGETKTSRLIDNITSITPGALKGGLLAVDRHPGKDELLIGGSDGAPKIYKMFRDKDRKIGDDFNLIRKFAAMPGRVFAVAYSKDGTRIAAGSSYNGKGEVRVFEEKDGKLVCKLEGNLGGVYAVAFSPDGQQIASAGFDGVVRLNDANNGSLIREFVPCPVQTAKK